MGEYYNPKINLLFSSNNIYRYLYFHFKLKYFEAQLVLEITQMEASKPQYIKQKNRNKFAIYYTKLIAIFKKSELKVFGNPNPFNLPQYFSHETRLIIC